MCLTDKDGTPVNFEVTTFPHRIAFQTQLGEFGLVFQDRRTLTFGLPPQSEVGLSLFVEP